MLFKIALARSLCGLLAMMAGAALAQPVENVTVEAARTRQAIAGFVQSYVAPTRLTDKLARWETGICPRVMGLPPALSDGIVARLKAAAQDAGAPLGSAGCHPNIDIVFTAKPQALLDDIRVHKPDLLGYFDSTAAVQESAVFRHPIQAWYLTETVDVRGQHMVDSMHGGGLVLEISPKVPPIFIPHAHAVAVTGSRLGDGLRSGFFHVLIVADPVPLRQYEKETVGDAVAMLALSQPAALTCFGLPGILNLLTPNCPQTSDVLTANDRALLLGLYHMSPEGSLQQQREQMIYRMQHELIAP